MSHFSWICENGHLNSWRHAEIPGECFTPECKSTTLVKLVLIGEEEIPKKSAAPKKERKK